MTTVLVPGAASHVGESTVLAADLLEAHADLAPVLWEVPACP